jgi:hypothetical protein
MKLFECQHCGQPLYFENTRCESCGRMLGYLPRAETVTALEQDADGFKALAEPAGRYRYCANVQHGACNWLVPLDSPHQLCVACRHNLMIPDLSTPDTLAHWRRSEFAKHRLFYTLLQLRLPLITKAEDPERGLAFDVLAPPPPGAAPVITGHAGGLITINLAEADDALRERARNAMHEPYRTLLGHFRHEIAHYYWDRLIGDRGEGPERESFRALFGDERADYAAALKQHYDNGPPADWQEHFVTAYASAHPWEDWAENWAHYFHMVDTLETAAAFGLRVRPKVSRSEALATAVDFDPHTAGMERIIDAWLPLTFAVNSINRSMGIADLYPFVLAPPVIVKLAFIHDRIRNAGGSGASDEGGVLRAVVAGLKRAVGSPDKG